MKDELSRLLKAHGAKRRQEKDVEEAEEKGHQVFQALAVDTIEKVIAPALEALSQELKGHGHEADVSLRVGTEAYPSAHLSFRIINRDDPLDPASASRLSFTTTPSQDRFEVRTEIWGREGKETGLINTGNPETRRIAEIDAGWVTAQGLSFVGCVLDRA
ncbi:MAG TPA: hypothetical protein VFO67_16405 [Gemmatimonadales bacterium]|nr:hypothetical protein [Gemmatimonadales bacterium]